MTRVLPLPAPARISSGPSGWGTASRCCALRPLRKSIELELRVQFSIVGHANVPGAASRSSRCRVRRLLQELFEGVRIQHLETQVLELGGGFGGEPVFRPFRQRTEALFDLL